MNAPPATPFSLPLCPAAKAYLVRINTSANTQLQEPAVPSRLCALPHDSLSAVCKRASLHSEATPSHIAGCSKALFFYLLGSEGTRLTLDVTSVNLDM